MSADRAGWDICRLGYRPAYDGIRALSLVLVAVTHGGAKFRGGFIGRNVFFVLSDFWITSLLLEEWHLTGRIDRRAFYGCRARRLLPALLPRSSPFGLLTVVVPGIDHGWSFVARTFAIIFYVGNWVAAIAGPRQATTSERARQASAAASRREDDRDLCARRRDVPVNRDTVLAAEAIPVADSNPRAVEDLAPAVAPALPALGQ